MADNTSDEKKSRPGRRRFLSGAAAAAGAGALGAPLIARAQQPVTLRWQSTWPQRDIFHEYALDYARKVNEMSAGRLKIEVLPAGAVVKAFSLIDAVHSGALDGGHGVSAYWYGRNSAFSLFGTGPALGMDANMLLAWMEYGGGRALYDELMQKILGFDVVGLLYGPMPAQPLGWFKKPLAKASDFKGLKFRTVGLSIDLFKEMGAAVTALPSGEIVPALEGGLIEAAEFNNASSDRTLGLQEVSKLCMLRSYHQPAEVFEILFNRKRYEALPEELRAVLRYAAQAASADMSWKALDRYSRDHAELQQKHGVRFVRTPEGVLRAQLDAWHAVAERKSRENPFFARVLDSQKAFARRVVGWDIDTAVDRQMAYRRWFGGGKT